MNRALFVVSVAFLFLIGCRQSSDLTRGEATKLLNDAVPKSKTEDRYPALIVEVTGITDVEIGHGKMVQYRASYSPQFVKAMKGAVNSNPRTGEAVFRLYDDGWRIEAINGKVYNPAAGLTPSP